MEKFILAFDAVNIWKFGQSNRCILLSFCFNLYFPDDMLKIFHMFICHLFIFFGVTSVQVICTFLNWVVHGLIGEF